MVMTSTVLQSPGYSSLLLVRLKELYDRGQLCDFSLVTDTDEIPVHGAVLCSASNFFKGLMNEGSMQEPKFFVQAFNAECIQTVVHFMYTGSLVLSQANIWSILALASQFEVPEVSELCQQYLKDLSVTPGKQQAPKKTSTTTSSITAKADTWQDPSKFISAVVEETRPLLQTGPVLSGGAIIEDIEKIKEEIIDISEYAQQLQEHSDEEEDIGYTDCGVMEQEHDDEDNNDNDTDFVPFSDTSPAVANRGKKRGRPRKKQQVSPRKKRAATLTTPENTTPRRGRPRKHFKNDEQASPLMTPTTKRSSRSAQKAAGGLMQTTNQKLEMYRCLLCNLAFSHQCMLRAHLKLIHRFQLEMQHKFLKHRSVQIMQHRAFLESSTCRWCFKVFQTQGQLLAHLVKQHPNSHVPYMCESCGKSFTHRKHLILHRLHKHLENIDKIQKKHKCSKCHRLFSFKKNLLRHNTLFHKSLTSPVNRLWSNLRLIWFCKQANCDFRSRTKNGLGEHMSSMHPEVRYVKVEGPKSVKPPKRVNEMDEWKEALRRLKRQKPVPATRLRECSQINGPPYICKLCDFSTKFKYNLQRHMISHTKNYVRCDICDARFDHKYHLKTHVLVKHFGERFVCELCGKAYQSKQGMVQHIRFHHMKTVGHKCNICSKVFGSKCHLESHINKHNGIRPFLCSICAKGFFSSGAMKRHEESCRNAKQKKVLHCEVCNLDFKSHNTLREHTLSKHFNRTFACLCGETFSWRKSLYRHKAKCKLQQNNLNNE